MRLFIIINLILLASSVLAHKGQLEYNSDSLNQLLEQELPQAQHIETLQIMLNRGLLWSSAISYLEILESYEDVWNTPPFKKYHIYKQAVQKMSDGNIEQGLVFLQQYIEACDKENIIMGMDSPLAYVRVIYRSLDKHKENFDYYTAKLQYYEENGPQENRGICWHGIAGYYNTSGNLNKSIEYYLKAAEIYEGYPASYGSEMAVVGRMYQEWGNMDKAIEYSQKAIPYLTEVKDYSTLCYASNTLVKVYKRRGHYEKALQTGLQTLEQLQSMSVFKVHTLLEVGDTYVSLNHAEKAFPYIQKAAVLSDTLNMSLVNRSGLFEMDFVYYKYYYLIGDLDEAEQYLLQALRKAENGNIPHFRQKYLKTLALFYHKQSAFEKAADFASQHMAIADSIAQNNNSDVIAEYELEQNEIRAKQETKMLNKKRKSQVRNLSIAGSFFLLLAGAFFSRMKYIQKTKVLIEKEKNRSEELLLNILPYEVAEELKSNGTVAAKEYNAVTILLSDFKGFTQATELMTAHELVNEINTCFKFFDYIMEKYRIEKIKTMGDAYMAASGIAGTAESSAKNAVLAALEMQLFIKKRKESKQEKDTRSFEMRIGIHTGSVIAGVVGVKKFQYDLWGDTVNSAARMESNGHTNKVNISQTTYELIKNYPEFTFEQRGFIEVKGKGEMVMYFVRHKDISNES